MDKIIVVPKNPNTYIPWSFGRVVGRHGQNLMIEDLLDGTMKKVDINDVREVRKIPLFSLVVPRKGNADWQIGQVIGMSRLDLPFGPLLHIKDILTGVEVKLLPCEVDRIIRDKSTQLA